MAELENEANKDTPEVLFTELDATENEINALQKDLTEKAQMAGFALEAIRCTREYYVSIVNHLDQFEELNPFIASGIQQARAIKCEVKNIRQNLADPFGDIRGMTSSVYTSCSTSGSLAASVSLDIAILPEYPAFLCPDGNHMVEKLTALNAEVANTYLEIDQAQYGTNADNLRASLAMARQAFDHFFEVLAPDEKVRNSRFWKRKPGELNEDLVTRRERIHYAIENHVKNQFRAMTLLSSVDNILDAYKGLNSLHERGRVNSKSAKLALFTVKHFIEEFTEAIEL